jgi:hypothetical protein
VVHQPEPAAAFHSSGRPLAVDQRTGEPPAVADLADERTRLLPDAGLAAAAAVAQAVGGELVDREHEVGGALAAQPAASGLAGGHPAEQPQRVGVEGENRRRPRRLRQRYRPRPRLRLQPAIGGACHMLGALEQEGMAAVRLRHHLGIQLEGVIGAQQPPGPAAGERHVEQCLVALTLGQLVGAASLPDRLPDAAQQAAAGVVGLHELAPGGDDAAGVGAHLLHVGEVDGSGVGAQLLAQHIDLGRADHDQRRLLAGDAIADEGRGPFQELGVPGIEQRLVPEGGADHG